MHQADRLLQGQKAGALNAGAGWAGPTRMAAATARGAVSSPEASLPSVQQPCPPAALFPEDGRRLPKADLREERGARRKPLPLPAPLSQQRCGPRASERPRVPRSGKSAEREVSGAGVGSTGPAPPLPRLREPGPGLRQQRLAVGRAVYTGGPAARPAVPAPRLQSRSEGTRRRGGTALRTSRHPGHNSSPRRPRPPARSQTPDSENSAPERAAAAAPSTEPRAPGRPPASAALRRSPRPGSALPGPVPPRPRSAAGAPGPPGRQQPRVGIPPGRRLRDLGPRRRSLPRQTTCAPRRAQRGGAGASEGRPAANASGKCSPREDRGFWGV